MAHMTGLPVPEEKARKVKWMSVVIPVASYKLKFSGPTTLKFNVIF
jgi:hypothetical protein